MFRLLEFLAQVDVDCTGYGWVLVRTIQERAGFSHRQIYLMTENAERDGLVDTIRLSLSGPEGLLSITITEKGRKWLKTHYAIS